ncbi:MAG: CotH kinase family protein [bacterium]|nr:CotH kinase family protein [bacterium]
MTLKNKWVGASIGAVLLAGGTMLLIKFVFPEPVRRPIVNEARGLYVALERLTEIPQSLTARLKPLPVPAYRLVIDPEHERELDDYFRIQEGNLDREKIYVPAVFYDPDGRRYDVRVTYRGDGGQHFRFPQKSWRIVFPDESLFMGKKAITLIYPEEREFLVEATNFHRAKKLGLAAPETGFVYLFVNRHEAGLYYEFEHWSEELLERNRLKTDGNLYGEQGLGSEDLYRSTSHWQQYVANAPGAEHKEDLALLIAILNHPSDEYFNRNIDDILDLETFYRWNVHALLSGSEHQDAIHNARLYFDPTLGKFKYIPWDVNIGDLEAPIESRGIDPKDYNPLVLRILAHQPFLEKRNRLLREYLADSETVADDFRYYDELYQTLRPAFYRDTLKNYSNRFFREEVARYRDILSRNIAYLQEHYLEAEPPPAAPAERERPLAEPDGEYAPPVPTGDAFTYFHDISRSPEEFLAAHPNFSKDTAGELHLGPGSVVLRATTLVPENTRLHIEAGTDVFLDAHASLVSYSAIDARGTAERPIRFLPLSPTEPWGTLAIIDAPNESRFENVFFLHTAKRPDPPLSPDEHRTIAGPINGMLFRGMVTVRHAAVSIAASTFAHAAGDDALSVQYGSFAITDSLFRDNSADAFDADFASGTIMRTAFRDSGNDGVDIDGTKALVEDVVVTRTGDKGFSLGASTELELKNSVIDTADIGVAIKDDSSATLTHALIVGARIGINIYHDNPIFPAATATAKVSASVIAQSTERTISVPRDAQLAMDRSIIEGGFPGSAEDVIDVTPRFRNAAAGDYRLLDAPGGETIGLRYLPRVPR